MDEHTLVAAERDTARPSLSREWVDKCKQRSMRTSLRGGGTTGWSLVRAKVAKSSLLLVRERIQSNSSIASVDTLSSVALKNNIQTDALCK